MQNKPDPHTSAKRLAPLNLSCRASTQTRSPGFRVAEQQPVRTSSPYYGPAAVNAYTYSASGVLAATFTSIVQCLPSSRIDACDLLLLSRSVTSLLSLLLLLLLRPYRRLYPTVHTMMRLLHLFPRPFALFSSGAVSSPALPPLIPSSHYVPLTTARPHTYLLVNGLSEGV